MAAVAAATAPGSVNWESSKNPVAAGNWWEIESPAATGWVEDRPPPAGATSRWPAHWAATDSTRDGAWWAGDVAETQDPSGMTRGSFAERV